MKGIVIPAGVYAQLEAIRRTGEVNMGGRQDVQAAASRLRFFDAVVWLQENQTTYFQGFIGGFTPDRELSDEEQETIDNARDGWL